MAGHFRAPKALIQALAIIACSVGSANALADSCKYWNEIRFSDGSKGCLTDYPIADMRPHLYLGSLSHILPGFAYTVIAVTTKDAMCPIAVGLGSIAKGNFLDDAKKATLSAYALRNCEAALENNTNSKGGPCGCEVVITDGTSSISKPAFDAMVLRSNEARPTALAAAAAEAPTGSGAPSAKQMDAIYQDAPAPVAASAAAPAGAPTPQSSKPDGAQQRPSARALVIGNSNYQRFGKLNNPRNDATAIADKLRSFGMGVDLLLDANRATLAKALNAFQGSARDKDVNIVYYAGHSAQINGSNYLIPTDMPTDSVAASFVKLNAIAMNDVVDYMPAKAKIIVMEACRENAVSKSVSNAGLAPVNAALATYVVYANKDCASSEEKAHNSAFTAALLQNMAAPQDIGVVLRKVRQAVLAQSANKQESWESGTLVGDELILSRLSR